MLRGTKQFKCERCGEVFTAPDMELNATASTAPQPCPKCGTPCKPMSAVDAVINLFKPKKSI